MRKGLIHEQPPACGLITEEPVIKVLTENGTGRFEHWLAGPSEWHNHINHSLVQYFHCSVGYRYQSTLMCSCLSSLWAPIIYAASESKQKQTSRNILGLQEPAVCFPSLSGPILLLSWMHPLSKLTAGRVWLALKHRLQPTHWQSPSLQLKPNDCCGFHFVLCRSSLPSLGYSCVVISAQRRPAPISLTASVNLRWHPTSHWSLGKVLVGGRTSLASCEHVT